jgi:hypothetical protein
LNRRILGRSLRFNSSPIDIRKAAQTQSPRLGQIIGKPIQKPTQLVHSRMCVVSLKKRISASCPFLSNLRPDVKPDVKPEVKSGRRDDPEGALLTDIGSVRLFPTPHFKSSTTDTLRTPSSRWRSASIRCALSASEATTKWTQVSLVPVCPEKRRIPTI